MTTYFLSKDYCRDTNDNIDMNEIFSRIPFYNDYYTGITIQIDDSGNIVPLVMSSDTLINQYGIEEISTCVSQVHDERCEDLTSQMNICVRLLELVNGWWCLYVERRYFWESFESKGVVIVLAKDRGSIDTFREKYLDKLNKRSVKINRGKLRLGISNVS